ncbi:MAG: RidA family protein, partial [Dehalococcoidia bacterium]
MVVEYRNVKALHQTGRFSHYASTSGGRTLYLSGQVALDEDGNVVGEGDYEAQVRQVYDNLESVLDSAGATWADVAITHIYIVGFTTERYAKLREIRAEYIGD